MSHSPQQDLRLALHRFLDLCRDARDRDLDPGIRAWLAKVELSAWGCLAQYRHAEPAQQNRLLAHCLRLEDKTRHLTGIFPAGDPRATERARSNSAAPARLRSDERGRRKGFTAAFARAFEGRCPTATRAQQGSQAGAA